MSKRVGEIIGCKDKTSSWHLNRFPDRSNIGSTTVYFQHAHFYTNSGCGKERRMLIKLKIKTKNAQRVEND